MTCRSILLTILLAVVVPASAMTASPETGTAAAASDAISEADNIIILDDFKAEAAAAAEANWPSNLTITITVEDFSVFGDADIRVPGYTSWSCGPEKSVELKDVISWTLEKSLAESGIFGNVFTETEGDLLLFGQVVDLKKKGMFRRKQELKVALQLYDRVQRKELWQAEYEVPYNIAPMKKRIAGDVNYKYSLPFPELASRFIEDITAFLEKEREGAIKEYLNRWIFNLVVGDLYIVAGNRLEEPVEVRLSISDGRTYFMNIPAAPGKTPGDMSQVCRRFENQYGFFEIDIFALGKSATVDRFLFKAPAAHKISYVVGEDDAGEITITVEN